MAANISNGISAIQLQHLNLLHFNDYLLKGTTELVDIALEGKGLIEFSESTKGDIEKGIDFLEFFKARKAKYTVLIKQDFDELKKQ